MDIDLIDKIRIVMAAYSIQALLPSIKKRLALFIRPFDATRYVEFAYLLKFIKENKLSGMKILDISSPHMMSYILSRNNHVLKTNIDISEKEFIKENKNLEFKTEDATNLSLEDNSFDLVYSVSVIEHIYQNFLTAILEIIRVAKPGGYIYLTFPVSSTHMEEWLDKNFFQYRFDQKDVEKITAAVRDRGTTILKQDMFWEKKAGMYDKLTRQIRRKRGPEHLNFLKNSIINAWYGFTMFKNRPTKDFSSAKTFGNIHLILQKNK